MLTKDKFAARKKAKMQKVVKEKPQNVIEKLKHDSRKLNKTNENAKTEDVWCQRRSSRKI